MAMLSCLRSIVRGRRNSPSRRIPEEIEAPLGQLAMAIEAPNQRFMIYDRAEVVRADIFMPLDRYGSLAVYRAYVRLKDEPHEETAVQDIDGADALGQGATPWVPAGSSPRPSWAAL